MTTHGHAHPVDHTGHDCAATDMQLLLEATGVGTYSYDPATNTLVLDKVCRKMFDIGDDDVLNMENLRERIHPDDVDRYWAAAAESMQTGHMNISYRIIRKDGSVRFITARTRMAPGPDGVTSQIRGVCIDITDRRELELRLRDTQSRMQELADGIPGLFSLIDRDYRVVYMNSMYRELLGRSEEEVIGKRMAEIVGEEAFQRRQHNYDATLAGETIQVEANRKQRNQPEEFFAVSHKPYRNEDGEVVGIMTLAMDISDRRAFEEALARKSEELARSNHDLEQFAYVASHDLKAPLRSIELLVQWLQEDLRDYEGGEVQDNLGLLRHRTQRLNRLLDDLLEYSRAGRRVGSQRVTDTRELIRDITKLLAPPRGMQVTADDSLPTLETHHGPLEQVLRNLINNAIKHHPTHEGFVNVSAVDQGDAFLFAVEDDGSGIPEEYAEKVFEMFRTLQPRDEREGNGMGLAIVKRIIDWQGGRIWFHDRTGGSGTVFKFLWNKLPDMGSSEHIEDSDDVRGTDQPRQHSAG